MSNNVEYIISLRDNFTSKIKKLQNSIDQINKKTNIFSRVSNELSGVLGAVGFGAAAMSVIQLGTNMEQTRVAFSTFLGDGEKANKLLEELNTFANVTPYDNAGVIEAGKTLLAMGVTADNITGTLRSLGDVASGVNVPLNEMAQIYGKAMNKGKLQAEELNQLSERGVPIMDALAKKFGITKAEVYKFAEQGKITFDVFKEAFNGMSQDGGMFFQMMEKQSKTTAGKWSTLVGEAQKLGITLGESLLPIMNKLLEVGFKLAGWFSRNIDLIVKTIKVVLQLAKYYFYYVVALKATQLWLNLSTIATTAYRIAMIALNGGISKAISMLRGFKIALASTGIMAAVVLMGELTSAYLDYLDTMKTLEDKLKDLQESIKKPFAADVWNDYIKRMGIVFHSGDKGIIGLQEALKKIDYFDVKQIDKDLAIIESRIKHWEPLLRPNQDEGSTVVKQIRMLQKLKSEYEKRKQKIENVISPKTENEIDNTVENKQTKITSSAPKVFNINIDKLVENFTVSTSTLKESTGEIKEAVLNALLGSLNDTQIVLNQ